MSLQKKNVNIDEDILAILEEVFHAALEDQGNETGWKNWGSTQTTLLRLQLVKDEDQGMPVLLGHSASTTNKKEIHQNISSRNQNKNHTHKINWF